MIIDIDPNNLPLCPNQGPPVHPLHQLHIQLQEAAYESNPKNEDSEFLTSELKNMYNSIVHNQFNGRMYLYRDTVSVPLHTDYAYVESLYFRCYTCGLILPAVGKK